MEISPLEQIDLALNGLDLIRKQDPSIRFDKWMTETGVAIAGIFGGESGEIRVFQKTAGGLSGLANKRGGGSEENNEDEEKFLKLLGNVRHLLGAMRNVILERSDQKTESHLASVEEQGQAEDLRILGNQALVLAEKNSPHLPALLKLLEHLGLNAVVLRENSNYAQVPLESILDYHRIGHALAIYSDESASVLEFGFLLGRLGSKKLTVLVPENVSFPFDYARVNKLPIDPGGAWKIRLGDLLKASGFKIG